MHFSFSPEQIEAEHSIVYRDPLCTFVIVHEYITLCSMGLCKSLC